MRLQLQVIFLLFVQGILSETVTLVARVSVGGVKGTVAFTQISPGGQTTVTTSLSGPNKAQAVSWQLHTFRVNYDTSDPCNATRLGPRILSSVNGTISDSPQTVNGLELSGLNSIEGRSIAFVSSEGNPVACGNVEMSGDYVTARATFRKTVLGDVIFRQRKEPSSSLTRVTVDLYTDGSQSSVRDLEWRIVEGGGCSTVGTAYNPGSVTGVCSSSDHSSCAVGDLKGKLGVVKEGVTMGGSRMTSADLNLPLSGAHSVRGKNLQLFVSGQNTPVACATISVYNARTGIATFDNDGVTGTITLTQPSPLDPARTVVDLKNLRFKAGGYHIHKYPVPQRLAASQSLCSAASVSGHFNPFGIVYDASSPAAATTTEDVYEVGDLSKKYGLLTGFNDKSATYTDFNLQLFGINSVLGRSLVIHYNQTGAPRWVCANVHDTAAMTRALATFTYPVIGHVLLQQRTGEAEAETSVYYSLDYGDGVSGPSTGHSWAVHVNAVNQDMLSSSQSTRCISAGDVMNPLNVKATNYATQCEPSTPLRCQLGDLRGKHEAVSVRAGTETPAIRFFTDVNLPLQGQYSVLGKAVVLKAAAGGSQNLACANLLKVWPQVVEAKSWGGADYGSVTFSQAVGVVQAPTTININLQSLSSHNMVEYSINNRPVTSGSGGNRCSNMGGLYNPFQTTGTGSTKDMIAVGDLTAKFGAMAGSSASGIIRVDPSLDVWGPWAVTGRAFSLAAAGTSVGCADIEPKGKPEGTLFKARAQFTGEIEGDIMLTQYVYPDGAISPTTVVVNLKNSTGEKTMRHNWHTHEKPVLGDAHATAGRCSSTGGHYNPFFVNLTSQYDECKISNPLRCELGDQSNKVGTYDMGSGPMVANDVYLPLSGPYGVIGRSIVVHTANRGAPRVACADILPATPTNSYLMRIKTPPTLDKAPMVQTIATAVKTETYNIAVDFLNPDTASECLQSVVYFLGLDAETNKQTFNNIIGGNSTVLGIYQPDKKCATGSANVVVMSLFLLVASLMLRPVLM